MNRRERDTLELIASRRTRNSIISPQNEARAGERLQALLHSSGRYAGRAAYFLTGRRTQPQKFAMFSPFVNIGTAHL